VDGSFRKPLQLEKKEEKGLSASFHIFFHHVSNLDGRGKRGKRRETEKRKVCSSIQVTLRLRGGEERRGGGRGQHFRNRLRRDRCVIDFPARERKEKKGRRNEV